MNYKKIYWDLIRKAIARGRLTGKQGLDYELHHAVPKCVGGGNQQYNLITLTTREHLFAHDVLARIGIGLTMTTKDHSLSYHAELRRMNYDMNMQQKFLKTAKLVEPIFKIFFGKDICVKRKNRIVRKIIVQRNLFKTLNDRLQTYA